MLEPLTFKLRAFLAKRVSQDFMHSFLGLIVPRNHPFLHRPAPPSDIVSGLNQVEDLGNQEIRRIFRGRMRTQAMTKLRGEGPSLLFYSPLSPSLRTGPFVTVPVLGCSSIQESYSSLTIQPSSRGQAGWSKGGRGCASAERISFVSQWFMVPSSFYSALAMGVTASETRQGGSLWQHWGWQITANWTHDFFSDFTSFPLRKCLPWQTSPHKNHNDSDSLTTGKISDHSWSRAWLATENPSPLVLYYYSFLFWNVPKLFVCPLVANSNWQMYLKTSWKVSPFLKISL